MRKLVLFFISILISLTACKKKSSEEVASKVVEDSEIINVGVYQAFEPFGIKNAPNLNFLVFDNPKPILERLISGDLDLGYIPSEAIEKIGQKEGLSDTVVSLNVMRREKIFLLSSVDKNINMDSDNFFFDEIRKNGKKIACFNFQLDSYYKAMEDILDILDFSLTDSEIIPALISGSFSYAILPEKYAELAEKKSSEIRKISNMNQFDFPRIVLAANGRFFNSHSDSIQELMK